MWKIFNGFLCFLLAFALAAEAEENSWRKGYGTAFKSAEYYSPLPRAQRWETEQRRRSEQQANLAQLQQIYRNHNAALIKEYSAGLQPGPAAQKLAANPPAKNTSSDGKWMEGKGHSIQTVERLDKKTTLTTVRSYSPDGKIIQLVEKFKIKGRGGVQVQKFTATQFDPAGNPLNRRLVENHFKGSGFFNTVFGKILGIALVTAAALFVPPAISAVAAGIAQFGVSLAQGQGFKNALISAGLSFAATAIGRFFGPRLTSLLGKLPGVGNALNVLNATLTTIGKNLAGGFGATGLRAAENSLWQKFALQVSLRTGSEVFSQHFGKKLGAFATVATVAVAGTLAASVASNVLGAPPSPAQFSQNFANAVFSGSVQGGIAEGLKNQRGLAAQFFNQLGSSLSASTSLGAVAKTFQAFTREAQKVFHVYWDQCLAPFSQVRQILSQTAIAKINRDFTGYQWELKAGNFDPSKGVNVFVHGWNAGSDGNKIVTWGLVPQERYAAAGDPRSAVVVLWESGRLFPPEERRLNTFALGIERANRAVEPMYSLLSDIFADVKRANPNATANVIGHSLAARGILGAAARAAEKQEQIADQIVLFSPAVENTALNREKDLGTKKIPAGEFYRAPEAVKSITNVFTRNDEALSPVVYQLFSPGVTQPALGKYGADHHGSFLPENVKEINATFAYDDNLGFKVGARHHSSYSRSGLNQVRFIYEETLEEFPLQPNF